MAYPRLDLFALEDGEYKRFWAEKYEIDDWERGEICFGVGIAS